MQTARCTIEFVFERGSVSAWQLQDVASRTLAELGAQPGSCPDGGGAHVGSASGPAVVDLRGAESGLPLVDLTDDEQARALELAKTATVSVVEGRQGVEPLLTTIVVALAVSVAEDLAVRGIESVAEHLWSSFVWPRICSALGLDALGDHLETCVELDESPGAPVVGVRASQAAGDSTSVHDR